MPVAKKTRLQKQLEWMIRHLNAEALPAPTAFNRLLLSRIEWYRKNETRQAKLFDAYHRLIERQDKEERENLSEEERMRSAGDASLQAIDDFLAKWDGVDPTV